MAQYWLLDWLDSEDVRTAHDVPRVLATKSGLDNLRERADQEYTSPVADIPGASGQVVAGAGMSLWGVDQCSDAACGIARVDQLLGRLWHYFDAAVVPGLDPWWVSDVLRGKPSGSALAGIEAQSAVALHIREIGAEDALIVTRSPSFCMEHLDRHAVEAGMPPAQAMADKLASELSKGSKLEVRHRSGSTEYIFTSPMLDTARLGRRKGNWDANKKFAKRIAKRIAQEMTGELISNVALAKMNHASLAQSESAASSKFAPSRTPTASEVAFELPLPSLENAPIREILAFRRHEAAEFQAFQAALRQGINEQIKALPEGNAAQVAASVLDDVIEPALIRIDQKVSGAADLLSKRGLVTSFAGTTVATVGFLALTPLAVGGITVGTAALLASVNDYLKEKREIRQDEMYFLWKILNEHGPH